MMACVIRNYKCSMGNLTFMLGKSEALKWKWKHRIHVCIYMLSPSIYLTVSKSLHTIIPNVFRFIKWSKGCPIPLYISQIWSMLPRRQDQARHVWQRHSEGDGQGAREQWTHSQNIPSGKFQLFALKFI